MVTKSRSLNADSLKSEIFFRVIPKKAIFIPAEIPQAQTYVFYLEKGINIVYSRDANYWQNITSYFQPRS